MSKPVDLLGQYISQVLIPRLNRADNLYNRGRQFAALRAQLSVVRVLYRRTEQDKELLMNWIKQVKAIEEDSLKIRGETRDIASFNRERYRNRKAEELYPKLDIEIWDKLHEFGYFEGRKVYGPDLTKVDPSGAEQM